MEGKIIVSTVEEAVEVAKQKLLAINIPAGLARAVGAPINDAIDLLQVVQDAWARDAAEQAAKEKGGLFPEPEINIEPMAEDNEPEPGMEELVLPAKEDKKDAG